MTGFWVIILICRSMYTVHHGRCWVSAQSLTESSVYQPDKKLSVDIGDSATLRCCVYEERNSVISWFKQPNGKEPRIVLRVFKNGGETIYDGFAKSRFKIDKHGNCVNMNILTTIQSDEATYYCASRSPYTVFGNGTYLKIKDKRSETSSTASETSKPASYNNMVDNETTPHGSSTNMNTQEKTEMTRSLHMTEIVLGTALSFCVLVIFSLTYFILRRKTNDETNVAMRESPGTRREDLLSGAETLNYAALQFSKRKAKAEKRKTNSSDECVYSDVKYNCRM